ncbi:hypothetical protein FHU31_004222 [Mycolicibacterium fluoranthenivorans]|uniref:Integrase catalytic domain-containing protein n=1 Tax=Mycolicibacterium fluoranthenivorans TaxID=258505 RepID=A0A7X5U2P4_9MYCO|nr:hypothetical protein [Mycolicibacterium fluoranthenivorans]NIH97232.1 hypothetical protein [Mycolicibacterium fluoranthenivorans]
MIDQQPNPSRPDTASSPQSRPRVNVDRYSVSTAADGRTLKMLNVIDEFTREALAIEVDRSIDADGGVNALDRLALMHVAPHYVRFDNGP